MINAGEDLLICDLAEVYGVLDWRSLRLSVAAALSAHLPDDSRIKRKQAGLKLGLRDTLLASIADSLKYLCWTKTADAPKGRNRPTSVLEALTKEPEEKVTGFDSAAAFRARREEIVRQCQKADLN
ncbi:MAG: DUF5361 domain-containing protein [Clostridia bacterium]|nr:DUF5361 domain-containing protein [Clostridia bacterium]